MQSKTFPAEFVALMEQYAATSAGLGADHPLSHRLWALVVHTAPKWFLDEMHTMAQELGLTPAPVGCDSDGRPVYELAGLAAQLGVTVEEVEQRWAQIQADCAAAGVPCRQIGPDDVHKVH